MRDEAPSVIGRDDELYSIQTFLDAVEQGPTALVLSGEPGIGKTALWESGVEEAEGRVGAALVHRSVKAEASLAFTGLSDLLDSVFDETAPVLPLPRRRALEVALLLAEPGEEPVDPRAIGLALLDLLRALAARGPVLIALDDIQWTDSSSAGVLQIALRRLRDERVGLLATLRKEPVEAAPFELESAFPEERLERVSLGPLSLGALHRLLRERLGLKLSRTELTRVQETSGGNPFFALELGRELIRTQMRPVAGEALPVPSSLRQLLDTRLARLPAETSEVLLSAAALARPTVEVIAAAHRDPNRAVSGLNSAVSEGLIEIDGSRLRFRHPLLASVCYEQASASKRREMHRALAGAVDDVEERARHLALAADSPDAVIATDLDEAAEQAAARGAPTAAAELWELGAKMTPRGDSEQARQRRLQAARFHRLSGDPERALTLLKQLLPEVPSGTERADVLLELARAILPGTRSDDQPRMIELCNQALAEASADDGRCARILAYRSMARLFKADIHFALADARAALEKAERVGDPRLLAVVIAHLALAESRAGEITPGLLERGAEIEERLGLRLEYQESPRVGLARQLLRTGELDRACALLEAAEAEGASLGNEDLRGWLLRSLGRVEWHAGRWGKALEHTAAALELWEQIQSPHGIRMTGYIRALIEADLGLVDDARASAEAVLKISKAMSDREWEILSLGALGRLELALGDLHAAGGCLRELPARLLSLGYKDPMVPVWSDTIETLVGLGDLEKARGYLEPYEANARRLGSPYAVACAARCRGLLAAAEGSLEAAFAAYEFSLAELEGLLFPLERGRTLLCLGSARRQAKQKRLARDALEGALAIFDQLGAPLWGEKARAELRRISGRRRASEEELTEMEERVATLAAEGRSNKEIAAELFVSTHTVSAHLSRTYRKLGIKSRGELAGRPATPTAGGTTPNPAR